MTTPPQPNDGGLAAMTTQPGCPYHPLSKMTELELLEMELEWNKLVQTMKLEEVLGPKGFEFSRKMFREAYSLGYMKAKP